MDRKKIQEMDLDGHENYLSHARESRHGGARPGGADANASARSQCTSSRSFDADGHEDYLAEARASRFDRTYSSPAVLAALLAAVVASRWAYIASPREWGVLIAFFVVAVFVLTTVFTLALLIFLPTRDQARKLSRLIYVGFAVFWVLPVAYNSHRRSEAAEQKGIAQEAAQAAAMDHRRQWRSLMEASGAHGPDGLEPPMLEVTDYGDSITITNVMDVALRDVTIFRCRLESSNAVTTCRSDVQVLFNEHFEPRASKSIRVRGYENAQRRGATLLSYKIGGPDTNSPSWWSDSALSKFDSEYRLAPADTKTKR